MTSVESVTEIALQGVPGEAAAESAAPRPAIEMKGVPQGLAPSDCGCGCGCGGAAKAELRRRRRRPIVVAPAGDRPR